MNPRRLTTAHDRQRGTVTLQFAMFAFGFFALAAVVVDMRIDMLTQQRMQDATDFAALEGMRYRDRFGDTDRRQRTRESIEEFFDDDFTPSNGDAIGMGAGPLISLVGGDPESNANALIVVDPNNRVYHPVPQTNFPNQPHGDLVAGVYLGGAATHEEFADYSRTDFNPSASGNGVGAISQAQPNFLVRLRRTNDLLGLDDIPGVSQSAPPIPLLFGLGSLVQRTPGQAYNPRTDGITVRSTSIGGARRAVTAAGPGPAFGFPALQNFVLLAPGGGALWDSLGVNASITLQRSAAGTLTEPPPSSTVWGRFAENPATSNGVFPRVGQVVLAAPATRPIPTGESNVPIVRVIGGVETVIGFGRITVSSVTPTTITITKRRGVVGLGGVSAIDPVSMASLGASAVLRTAHSAFSEPLLAPVLTR